MPAQAVASNWRTDALCRQADPELFHPDPADQRGIAVAKAICARCPVAGWCLAEALTTTDIVPLTGIWGGTTRRERCRPTPRASCGNLAGIFWHRRAGEDLCAECKEMYLADRRAAAGKRARTRPMCANDCGRPARQYHKDCSDRCHHDRLVGTPAGRRVHKLLPELGCTRCPHASAANRSPLRGSQPAA